MMREQSTRSAELWLDPSTWGEKGARAHDAFTRGTPYPHLVFDDFLPLDFAEAIHDAFPGPDHPSFSQPDNAYQTNKLGRL